MSLQGSLETFALPDVLVLLASTKKNGELRVVGSKVDGRIWVEKGQIVHSDVNGSEVASVDAVFELLRLDAGSFSFDTDNEAPARHEPDTVDLVLADAQVRLGEWNDIARVVPHLDVLVDMASEAPGDEVLITAGDWTLLRHVAGGCTVGDLMGKLGYGEFDTCKTVKRLVDEQLVSVDVNAKRSAKPAATAAAKVDAPAVKDELPPSVKVAPPKREPEPEPAPAAKAEPVADDAAAELERLVEEAASRPAARSNGSSSGSGSKVRANINQPGGPEAPEPAPAADKAPGDEAKALVAQLAALGGENEEKIAKKVEEHLARGGELPEVPEGDEPINRGLLLKFLSSVRN